MWLFGDTLWLDIPKADGSGFHSHLHICSTTLRIYFNKRGAARHHDLSDLEVQIENSVLNILELKVLADVCSWFVGEHVCSNSL